MGPLPGGLISRGSRLTPGGSVEHVFQLRQIVSKVTSDVSGLVGTATSVPSNTGIPLNTALFTRIANLAAIWDRMKLIRLRFEFEPSVGTMKDGALWWYIEYGAQTIATTAANASRMQGVRRFVPFRPDSINWRKQDNIDDQLVSSSGTVNFNTKQVQTLFVYGEGMTNSADMGYINAVAEVCFTGEQ